MANLKRKKLVERYLKCPNCNKIITLWSKGGRKEGHVKTMHCYFCGQLVNMIELNKYGYEEDLQ